MIGDWRLDGVPGGEGLGGASAASPLSGSARAAGGTSPNSPMDLSAEAEAEAEARVQAAGSAPAEPHPRLQ